MIRETIDETTTAGPERPAGAVPGVMAFSHPNQEPESAARAVAPVPQPNFIAPTS
jgi:hypothetical protein